MLKQLVSRILTWAGVERRMWVQNDPTWALAKLVDGTDKFSDPYLQHEWVYACIKSVATNIASVPLVHQTGSAKSVRVIQTGPIYDILNRPNALWSRWHLLEATISWLESCGNAIWVLKRPGPKVVPAEILCFGREGFEAKCADNAVVSYRYRHDGLDVTLQPHEVIHFRLWNPKSPVWGMGPLQAAMIAAESDYEASVYNRAFFKNSAIPGGIIEVPEQTQLTESEYQRMRERWTDMHGGSRKAFRTAVLEGGAKFQAVSLTHSDMQFLQQKKWNREAVCACFRVPPTEIGIFDAVHKATAEDTRRGYWEQTLIPLCKLIEDTLRAQFFIPFDGEKTWLAFDLSKVEALHESADAKIERIQKLWAMGMPFNMACKQVGYEADPIPGGDIGYLPLGVVPATEAGMVREGPDTPPDQDEDQDAAPTKAAPPAHTAALHTQAQIDDWRHFERSLQPSDRRFRESISAYLSRIKKWLAAELDKFDAPGAIPEDALMLAAKWDDELKKLANRHYRRVAEVVKPQVEARIRRAGIDFDLNLSDKRLVDYMDAKTIKVVEINDTIRSGLRDALKEGVTENLTMSELQESIFSVMQDSRARSLRIARTETTSAANGTEYVAHNIAGIKTHLWVASLDEATRDSHIACMKQGPIAVGKSFENGCRFPGDPKGDAGEVVNCRCTLVPVD